MKIVAITMFLSDSCDRRDYPDYDILKAFLALKNPCHSISNPG